MVIINGDDFGMNERCSLAVAQAFHDSAITDTTILANGDFFDGAVQLAFEQGFADRIGIHFNLTEGIPLTQAICNFSDFVCEGKFTKSFVNHPHQLTAAEHDAIYAELAAQIERLQLAGVPITHADSHHYLHNIGFLSPIVAQVCRDHGIGAIRLQRNVGESADRMDNNVFWREQGFATADYFCRMSDAFIGNASDVVEIMVHPDYDRHGRLIDRTGMEQGSPVGRELQPLILPSGTSLCSYRDVSFS